MWGVQTEPKDRAILLQKCHGLWESGLILLDMTQKMFFYLISVDYFLRGKWMNSCYQGHLQPFTSHTWKKNACWIYLNWVIKLSNVNTNSFCTFNKIWACIFRALNKLKHSASNKWHWCFATATFPLRHSSLHVSSVLIPYYSNFAVPIDTNILVRFYNVSGLWQYYMNWFNQVNKNLFKWRM